MNREEAIKIVKSHYPANKQMLNEALEFLIPELKEKTDEEVRQQLIAIVNLYYGEGVDAERDKCLEWLEKQVTPQVRTGIEWVNTIDDACDKRYSEEYAEGEYCHEQSFKWGFQEGVDWLEKQVEPEDKGEISDGYHTFNELYYYRMLYNAAFFNSLPKAWVHKSKKHHDGEECFGGGWFIVMANLPTGQISNHYELKDWELFQIPEKEVADEWDGHTPKEAAERLHKYLLRQKEQELLCDKCRKDNPYSSCQEVTAFGNCTVENELTQANKIEPKSTERKESTSIPFGTDNELIEEIIKIPDGYVATIEGNRIHIKKKIKN